MAVEGPEDASSNADADGDAGADADAGAGEDACEDCERSLVADAVVCPRCCAPTDGATTTLGARWTLLTSDDPVAFLDGLYGGCCRGCGSPLDWHVGHDPDNRTQFYGRCCDRWYYLRSEQFAVETARAGVLPEEEAECDRPLRWGGARAYGDRGAATDDREYERTRDRDREPAGASDGAGSEPGSGSGGEHEHEGEREGAGAGAGGGER